MFNHQNQYSILFIFLNEQNRMKASRLTSNIYGLIIAGLICVFLYFVFRTTDGFKAEMDGDRCGIDLKGCPSNRKCMNGVCYTTNKPCLPGNELPVYP